MIWRVNLDVVYSEGVTVKYSSKDNRQRQFLEASIKAFYQSMSLDLSPKNTVFPIVTSSGTIYPHGYDIDMP